MSRSGPVFAEAPPERRGGIGFAWGLIRGLGVASLSLLLVLALFWMASP